MANYLSAKKRIRQTKKRRLHNRYYAVTTRNAVGKLRATEDAAQAEKLYPEVVSMLDRLARRNIIHKNKASNLKSKLYNHVQSLKAAAQ